MAKNPPQVQFRKFIPVLSPAGIRCAELEFEALLRLGVPSLDFSRWKHASQNDILEGGECTEFPRGAERELIFCYFGTRRSAVGAYLFAYISIEKSDYLSMRAYELPFVKPMLADASLMGGTVILGQTNPDLRSLGRVSGRRSDVFAYILGLSAGLDRFPIRPGDEQAAEVFSVADFAATAREAFLVDEFVHVSGWSFGRFLRKCFRELSAVLSRAEFEVRFGRAGVKWRPRLIFR